KAKYGADIYNVGTMTLQNSQLYNGLATYGGGIYNRGTLTMQNTTVTGNQAPKGAGIYNRSGGNLTGTSSTLSDSASYRGNGGGILNLGTLLVQQHSTLSGNMAGVGGGIYNGGTATVADSTLSGNVAYRTEYGVTEGGGIENHDGASLLVINS